MCSNVKKYASFERRKRLLIEGYNLTFYNLSYIQIKLIMWQIKIFT